MSETPTQEEVLLFEMPDVDVGTPVEYYPNAVLNSGEPRLGFVVRISRTGRNVVIRTSDGGWFDAVRHIDDPKLQLNQDMRENGAWGRTEYDKELSKRLNTIEDRLASMQSSVDFVSKRLTGKSVSLPAAEKTPYHELREKAIGLGIIFKGNPKRGWLEETVKETLEVAVRKAVVGQETVNG
jgi:hypothetical protein|tara:strand:- start:4457 stop:5002 length:546 start_codon:yes stop_codon:yes gene_type:complete